MKVLFQTVLIWFYVKHVITLNCYWNTRCNYKYFSSKTPYEIVRGDIRDSIVKQKSCEPVSIWALIRHGQRNPGIDFGKPMRSVLIIKDHIISSYEKGNSTLCAQDVENLRNWQVNMDMFDKPFQLTKEGDQESKRIGQRLKQAFPKLLETLEKENYLIRPAPGQWIEDSAKAFIEGLYDKPLTVQPPKTDFDVITPYATCPKYKDIKRNPETYAESNKFRSHSEYLALKVGIQRRLGIEYSLTDANITALYDWCRYTFSGLTSQSPWCALFTTEDLKVLEYISDLRHYYRSSYGTPINELFGQIALTDLLKSFQNAKSEKGKNITTYITHATMMDMVFTALQLFKDDAPLTGSLRNPDRKWRSSKLSVLSSNLIVVLNKLVSTDVLISMTITASVTDHRRERCNKGADDYTVVFYLNEEPLTICKEGVCSWKEFEDKLSPFLNTNTEFCG